MFCLKLNEPTHYSKNGICEYIKILKVLYHITEKHTTAKNFTIALDSHIVAPFDNKKANQIN